MLIRLTDDELVGDKTVTGCELISDGGPTDAGNQKVATMKVRDTEQVSTILVPGQAKLPWTRRQRPNERQLTSNISSSVRTKTDEESRLPVSLRHHQKSLLTAPLKLPLPKCT